MKKLARTLLARIEAERLSRLLALAVCIGPFASPASAEPVEYELDVTGLAASGTFNGTLFSNAVLVLTFQGDTYLVEPFTVKGSPTDVKGFVNLVGTATVAVIDPFNLKNPVVGSGTFLPSAGIFISVDQTNFGIGFGSFGVPPSSPNFPAPGEVAYPAAILVTGTVPRSEIASYDLRHNLSLGGPSAPQYAIGCVGFPVPPCGAARVLHTTGGDLVLNRESASFATFGARVQPATPFASFAVNAEIAATHYDVKGSLTLGVGTDGLHPRSEVVTLHLDSYNVSVPPGSFRRLAGGGYSFQGKIANVSLNFLLQPKSSTVYAFNFAGTGSGVPKLVNPLKVTLTIGDDSGTKTVTATVN